MYKKILTAIGITILFLGTCIIPSVATDKVNNQSLPISSSNTLYVGGTGEGNYTSIQDAINDASKGDTVFVYDDSSPYYENIRIEKTINLIGENKNTTIIEGELRVRNSNDLIIQDFTFVGGDPEVVLFIVFDYCSNCTFYDNIIQNDILPIRCVSIWYSSDIKIFRNHITNICLPTSLIHIWWGVEIWKSQNCIIENNSIVGNKNLSIIYFGRGMVISRAINITVLDNHISGCSSGVDIKSNSTNITILHNQISRCRYGIEIEKAGFVDIIKNNFILNIRKLRFSSNLKDLFSIFFDGNFWGRPRIHPKIIFGRIGRFGLIPWFNIDWHPASEPYNIEV